ncbi:hypothetical protein LUZ60_010629 [Juncus effusus]|nr:hypothetical protein LUZ60_010629 [Juncus effusus]
MVEREEVEEEKGGVTVLDFDMLCAAVAAAAPAKKAAETAEEEEEEGWGLGSAQRMWEGELLGDFLDDRPIAMEASCCPCYRFGKNMRKANLGSCFLQGAAYLIFRLFALFSLIAFFITRNNSYLYFGVGSALLIGIYLGYFRTKIRKQFNIRGNDSSIDDCVSHLLCPCCTLSQESRTLEMNNVQSGVWHGRGETICLVNNGSDINSNFVNVISPDLCSMDRKLNGNELEP